MAKKPIIGITMGDPAGNGSEISVKHLQIRLFMKDADRLLSVMRTAWKKR